MIGMHQVVRVIRDVPEEGVTTRMIGAVIGVFDHPERAYEVESVDAEGRTIVQATLTDRDLEVVKSDEESGPVS
jgi:uncharacterized protein DUF4926